MTVETILSILILSLMMGGLGYLFAISRTHQDIATIKARIPLSKVLEAVTEEMIQAHIAATERGFAVMQFKECEFEFAVETEESGNGKVTVWALEISGGAKQTQSSRVRVKYKNINNQPMQAEQSVDDDANGITEDE